MNHRNELDESLLSAIGNLSPNQNCSHKLIIYDARPYMNALANRMASGGYENTKDYYKDCDIIFCDIDNIHAVRDSITKLHELGNTTAVGSNQGNPKWVTLLHNTNWLQLISKILSGVNKILETITTWKLNVLIHCSDGWDRTAQLSALA